MTILDSRVRAVDDGEPGFPGRGNDALALERLAFLDVETSGVSPAADRIVEIGVVIVDGGKSEMFSTLLDPRLERADRAWTRPKYADRLDDRPPRFRDIAARLAALLDGRLVIAHNARFDVGFLRSEFARLGVRFEPAFVCSLMLSRRLYPGHARHDLDSIAERHGLRPGVRHRALPDADLLRQFWSVIETEHGRTALAAVVADLLSSPAYPPHLDHALIERLPEHAGCFILYGETGEALDAGAASNVRRRVRDYFRADLLSARALAISHRVREIRWHAARGPIAARLALVELPQWRALNRRAQGDFHVWRLDPQAEPVIRVAPIDGAREAMEMSYGLFGSERRARNALARLAMRRALCLRLLGIAESPGIACTRCLENAPPPCMKAAGRLRELVRTATAISERRLPEWPFPGPVGLREAGAIHVLDRWRYRGAATDDAELRAIIDEAALRAFDVPMFELLHRLIERYRHRIVELRRAKKEPAASAGSRGRHQGLDEVNAHWAREE